MRRDVAVRAARPADVPWLLVQMRALAAFEGYLGDFRVDEDALRQRTFGERPECFVRVAEAGPTLCGYAVGVVTPFTYDLTPTVTLKELWVEPAHRGRGVAEALFGAVRLQARAFGARRMAWLVLPDNAPAQRFYRRQGGEPDARWQRWCCVP